MPLLGSVPYPVRSECSCDGCHIMSRMNEMKNCSHFARAPPKHSHTHGMQLSWTLTHCTQAETCLNLLDRMMQRTKERAS
eukprot:2783756-Alexandrium_andersonii.AAC.1